MLFIFLTGADVPYAGASERRLFTDGHRLYLHLATGNFNRPL